MPLIHVTMIEGRTADQKRALLSALTQAVHESIEAPLDSIRVWVTDVPSEQFMVAGTLAADRQADEPPPQAAASPLGETGPAGAPPAPPVDPIGAGGGPGLLP